MVRSRARPRSWLLLILMIGGLSACASPTPYVATTNGDGYGERRLETDRYRVRFAGNSLTPLETVETYLLHRAAEITLESGNDHFVIVDGDTLAETRFLTTASGFGSGRLFRRHGGFGTFGGLSTGTTRPITRFEAVANIVVRPGPKPEDAVDAYDARDVIARLGPSLVRPEGDPAPDVVGAEVAVPETIVDQDRGAVQG